MFNIQSIVLKISSKYQEVWNLKLCLPPHQTRNGYEGHINSAIVCVLIDFFLIISNIKQVNNEN